MSACIQVFVASDHPLGVIPFNRDAPAFYVVPPAAIGVNPARETAVRRWLGKQHLYFVGSHLGCGCGFGFNERDWGAILKELGPGSALKMWGFPSPRRMWQRWQVEGYEREFRRSSYQLAAYLEKAVEAGEVELLICWLDEEENPPKPRKTVTPAYFRGSPNPFLTGITLDMDKGDYYLVKAGGDEEATRDDKTSPPAEGE